MSNKLLRYRGKKISLLRLVFGEKWYMPFAFVLFAHFNYLCQRKWNNI